MCVCVTPAYCNNFSPTWNVLNTVQRLYNELHPVHSVPFEMCTVQFFKFQFMVFSFFSAALNVKVLNCGSRAGQPSQVPQPTSQLENLSRVNRGREAGRAVSRDPDLDFGPSWTRDFNQARLTHPCT